LVGRDLAFDFDTESKVVDVHCCAPSKRVVIV